MNKHHTRTKPCAHCGHRFHINPRVGRRHRFCAKPECRRISRAKARKRWLKKNGGRRYFDGDDNAERVRSWRKRNPGYWRRESRAQAAKPKKFTLTKRLAAALRFVALQDSIDSDLALKIGIISELCGATLQDTIARELRRLMLRGDAILRGKQPRR